MKEDSLPKPSAEKLRELNEAAHARCFTHVAKEKGGLGLEFTIEEDGSVRAEWDCSPGLESYENVLHGGIQATLMDSAMVQALFARGIVGRTGEMTVRYHSSVDPRKKVVVTAKIEMAHPPLFKLVASIYQEGSLCAAAKAKFMSRF